MLFVLLRNFLAGDGIGTSANFRYHISNGFHLVDPTYNFKCEFTSNYDSAREVLCITWEKISNPTLFVEITFNNLKNTIAPYIGNLGYGRNIGDTGTWWHAFDFRRILGFYTWADENTFWWYLDRIFSIAWVVGLWVSIIIGVYLCYTRDIGNRAFVSFLVFATLSSIMILLAGQGDSRYRLGFIPFYTVFIAVSLLKFFGNDKLIARSVN